MAQLGPALPALALSCEDAVHRALRGEVRALVEQLVVVREVPDRGYCVVNAAALEDMDVLVAGLLAAEAGGRRFLVRSAASFVQARAGLPTRELLDRRAIEDRREDGAPGSSATRGGGLIVVGSWVPRSTEQLERLLERGRISGVEVDVPGLLDPTRREAVLAAAGEAVSEALRTGRDVVVWTSRTLAPGADGAASLAIARTVSDALVALVAGLPVRPRFLIAKGGITSSDIATRALGVRRARVAGQLLPGVPVWTLGPETRYPGMHYVIFPGNVGGPDALLEALERLAPSPLTSSREGSP